MTERFRPAALGERRAREREHTSASPGVPELHRFAVRIVFDDVVSGEELCVDLEQRSGHQLGVYQPTVSTTSDGLIEVSLSVPGSDVWSSLLTVMAVIHQSGYHPAAVQVATHNEFGQSAAA